VISSSITVKITGAKNEQSLSTIGDVVGVIVGVCVGVGLIEFIVASIKLNGQAFVVVGVTLVVGVTVVVGVTDGVKGKSQSNKDVKSKEEQLLVCVGVGVGQVPTVNNSSHKSGQVVEQGDLPDKKQVPPNVSDKHHCVSPDE
jgi:hypothetical protein